MKQEVSKQPGMLGIGGSGFQRFLKKVEIVGNKLPSPFLLFIYCILIVLAIAHILNGTTFQIPGNADLSKVQTLLNGEGLVYMLQSLPKNFINFAPIGLVLPIVLAVGIGERAGLFKVAVLKLVRSVPKSLVTAVFIFCGINGNLASDASVVLFPVIGAALFKGLGRNPMIGIIAGFAAYQCGLGANILIAGTDATAAGITQQACQVLPELSSYVAHPAINWYFMFISTFFLTIVATFVTEKIVAPILDNEEFEDVNETEENLVATEDETRGLRFAGIATVLFVVLILIMVVPSNAILRNPDTNTILPRSPFISSLVSLVVLFFMVTGIAYGIGAKVIKSSYDVAKFMSEGIKSMSGMIVICFFAAQFTDYFNKTNLASFIAVKGADFLSGLGLTGIPLLLIIILFVTLINLTMTSAAAKWAMLAPVLVPMLALMGYSPAFSQCVYRVGDACTNSISPLNNFLPIIIGFLQKYKKDAGVGTVIAYELPYAIFFLIAWTVLLVIWYLLGLPLGPGASIGL